MTRDDIAEGAGYLNELLLLLPALRSVVLVGRKARSAARLLRASPGVRVFQSPHPSPSNLHTRPRERDVIVGVYREAWAHATGEPAAVACRGNSNANSSTISNAN